MKRFLSEPLLHFFVLGAAIFGAHAYVSDEDGPATQAIVVTQGRIESLITGFTRTWQRPPTEAELRGLIDNYIREEVCSREALAIGLDRDDTIIRRRLRQKLEFVTENLATDAEPTDSELLAYLTAHPELFRVDPHFTFKQVYLNTDRRGDTVPADVATLLAELILAGPNANPALFGDTTLLERTFEDVAARDVVKQFGAAFAEALGDLPIGQWQGPVESGYGVHLVLVSGRNEGRLPAMGEVRDDVRRNWTNARRSEANEKFYQSLLERYSVTIEPWAAATTTWQTAGTR